MVSRYFYHAILCIWFVENSFGYYVLSKSLNPRKYWRLQSIGDPDLSLPSTVSRQVQDLTRAFDHFIYPCDPDVPAWTFPSRIEWAPWLESIWFGNLYDYRSAFFHDVMYSNGKLPAREGALLYSNFAISQCMALIYQRYQKFNTSVSYSTPNVTFYNVFSSEAYRLGRYKIPNSNKVILSVNDPLTFSEMKRYLNFFSPLKYFKMNYFHIKRKRQVIFDIDERNPFEFYDQFVYELQYGRVELEMKFRKKSSLSPITIASYPTLVNDSSIQSISDKGSALVLSLDEMNSQYILENFAQGLVESLAGAKGLRIVVGGDGRLLTSSFLLMIVRVLAGQEKDIISSVELPPSGLLTSAEARRCLRLKSHDVAIVLTGGDQPGGIKGSHGISVFSSIHSTSPSFELTNDEWSRLLQRMSLNNDVSILLNRFRQDFKDYLKCFGLTTFTPITTDHGCVVKPLAIPSAAGYFSSTAQKRIKSYLEENVDRLTIDCLSSPSTIQSVSSTLKVLDFNLSYLGVNDEPIPDLRKGAPSLKNERGSASRETFRMFDVTEDMHASDGSAIKSLKGDICFVLSGDSRALLVRSSSLHDDE